MRRISWLGVIFLLLVSGNGRATERITPVYSLNPPEIAAVKKDQRGWVELYGEVAKITADEVTLVTSRGSERLTIHRAAPIFCNNAPAKWEALRPITPSAFFEAMTVVNSDREVLALNGFYYGEEVMIQSWGWRQERMELNVRGIVSGETATYRIGDRARLPAQAGWLRTEQVVFVLFNYRGEIRGIYLPD